MRKIIKNSMRILVKLAFVMLISGSLFAQVPDKMSYQAVVRDAANKLVVNKSVGIQINILQGSLTGAIVYTETQKATTNINGLVTLEIGGGAGFATIDWTAGPFFIQTKIDPVGGTSYTITGASQILSVPFALSSGTAVKLSGPLNEKDPVFTAWDKSTGISIKEKQISDLKHFTTADETDPVFKAWNKSDGITIKESQISDLKHFTNANEIDPVFNAWNKSTGILIKQNQITDLKLFTTADEKDPVFSAWNKSTGITIKENQITDLKHFTTADEIDPVFKASVAAKITRDDTLRWNLDTDPENELQYLFKTDHKISLTKGGFITTDLQDAYYNGDSITTFRGPVVINASSGGGTLKLLDNYQANYKVLISNNCGIAHWDSIYTPSIAHYAVTTIKLAPNSVDSTKIQTGAVLSSEIRDNSIMDVDVNTNAEIQVSKLHEGSTGQLLVTNGTTPVWTNASGDVLIHVVGGNAETEIQPDSVTASEINPDVAGHGIIQEPSGALGLLPDNSTLELTALSPFDTIRVKDLGITTRKLAPNSVDSTKIQTGAVKSSEIFDGAIINADVNTSAEIDISKLKEGPANYMIISDGTNPVWVPMSNDIHIDASGNATIQPLSVETGMLADDAVTTPKILNKNVTYAKIQDVANLTGSGTVLGRSTNTAGTIQEIATTGTGDVVRGTHPTIEGVIATGATGTGALVFAGSPTLITPDIGAATATTINGNAITTGTGTLTLNSSTLSVSSGNLTLQANPAGSTVTVPATGTLATLAGVETLTNKTVDADLNTITNIENADIKAGADIAISKLAGSATEGDMIVTQGGVPVWVPMSGSVTINNAGVTTIGGDLDVNDIRADSFNGNTITTGGGTLDLADNNLSLSGDATVEGTNTGDQDLSGLATKIALVDSIAQVRSEIPVYTAGTGIDITGNVISSTGSSGDFADFYALMPPDNAATVAVGSDVAFPQDGPNSGSGVTRSGPSTFNLSKIGIYSVTFQVSITEAGQLILTLNGSQLPYTIVGRATGTSQLFGTCLVQTTVINSILTVRNPAGNPTALTITPLAGGFNPVSAHLVIMQIK